MTRKHSTPSTLGVALLLLSACRAQPTPVSGVPGDALPGLPRDDAAAFAAGAALFNRVFTPEDGLGPAFNENQCSACHTSPAPGGTTQFEFVRRATRFTDDVCDPLLEHGGPNIRTRTTPALQAAGVTAESVPDSVGRIARFSTTPLYGLGLVEAIPGETLHAAADSADADGNGISGRVGYTWDGRLARFGRKGDHGSIEEFVTGAAAMEMGLTSPARPVESGVNGHAPPAGTDPAPDPELDTEEVEALTAFVRFLVPPARAEPRSSAHRDTLWAGERLFADVGCTECHTPVLTTGPNDNPALDRKLIALYSDLLLHDLGPAFADACGPAASPSEVRTEMLMGLQYRRSYLHDGRATDLESAINAHGGEAARARAAFGALTWLRQQYLLEFLRSL